MLIDQFPSQVDELPVLPSNLRGNPRLVLRPVQLLQQLRQGSLGQYTPLSILFSPCCYVMLLKKTIENNSIFY